jgi:hypothetical protein
MHEEVVAASAVRGAEVAGWSVAQARGGGRPTVPPRRGRAWDETRSRGPA